MICPVSFLQNCLINALDNIKIKLMYSHYWYCMIHGIRCKLFMLFSISNYGFTDMWIEKDNHLMLMHTCFLSVPYFNDTDLLCKVSSYASLVLICKHSGDLISLPSVKLISTISSIPVFILFLFMCNHSKLRLKCTSAERMSLLVYYNLIYY